MQPLLQVMKWLCSEKFEAEVVKKEIPPVGARAATSLNTNCIYPTRHTRIGASYAPWRDYVRDRTYDPTYCAWICVWIVACGA